MLLAVELLDELYAGVPSVGAPGIQEGFAISYQGVATSLLVVPGLVALLLEPFIFLAADRYPRRWFVVGGLTGMAVAAFASALAPSPAVLAASLSLAFVASGTGVALAQATLADRHAGDRERILTRWALLGEIGDLAAPALFLVLGMSSLGWRSAYVAVGAASAALALLVWRHDFPPADTSGDEDDEPGVLASIRDALGNRKLLVWLAACFTCELLDEIFAVFAALRLRDELGADVRGVSLALAGCVAGAIVGLMVSERLVRRRPLETLAASAALCAASYAVWLGASDLLTASAALFAIGATAAPLYPIAIAQAYAALPGRSGTVNAAGHLFTPLTLALPWLLGWVADQHGTTAALLLLVAQPIALATLGVLAMRRRG